MNSWSHTGQLFDLQWPESCDFSVGWLWLIAFAKFLGRLLARLVASAGLPLAKRLDPRVTPSVLRHTAVGWTRTLALALRPALIAPRVATKLWHWFAFLIGPIRRNNLPVDTSDVPNDWCSDANLAVKHTALFHQQHFHLQCCHSAALLPQFRLFQCCIHQNKILCWGR